MGNIHDTSTVLIIRKVIEIYKQKVTHLAIYGELFLQQKNSNLNPCCCFLSLCWIRLKYIQKILDLCQYYVSNILSKKCIKYLTQNMYQISYTKYVSNILHKICIKYLTQDMYQISYTKYVSNILQKKCIKCVRKEIRITLNWR